MNGIKEGDRKRELKRSRLNRRKEMKRKRIMLWRGRSAIKQLENTKMKT